MNGPLQPIAKETPLPVGATTLPAGTVVWSSEEILKGTKEIQIIHRSEIYRLRLTRNSKLILSK